MGDYFRIVHTFFRPDAQYVPANGAALYNIDLLMHSYSLYIYIYGTYMGIFTQTCHYKIIINPLFSVLCAIMSDNDAFWILGNNIIRFHENKYVLTICIDMLIFFRHWLKHVYDSCTYFNNTKITMKMWSFRYNVINEMKRNWVVCQCNWCWLLALDVLHALNGDIKMGERRKKTHFTLGWRLHFQHFHWSYIFHHFSYFTGHFGA